jgi:uncharacterized membrane protein
MKTTRQTQIKLLVVAVFCISLLLALTALAIAIEYEYTELLPPYGEGLFYPAAINDNGVVAGSKYKVWDPFIKPGAASTGIIYQEGAYTEVLPPRLLFFTIMKINNQGVVLGEGGFGTPFDNIARSFLYHEGTYTELLPSGWHNSYAGDINNNGIVVGHVSSDNYYLKRGYRYNQGLYITLPPWPPLFPISIFFVIPQGINDRGTVVGSWHRFREWTPSGKGFINFHGIYKFLLPPGWHESEALDINNSGEVIGRGLDGSNKEKYFLYRRGIYTEILPPGWGRAYAAGINNDGEVVGHGIAQNLSKGFVYYGGMYTEVIPPGWQSSFATAINNNGVIVGYGVDGNSEQKWFIAVPK